MPNLYSNFDGYGSSYKTAVPSVSMNTGNSVWVIISLVLAVVLGLVLYFTFLSKKNEGKNTGFLGWMYDFLTFKKMVIENILKILYLMVAIFITLSSFAMISSSFLAFVGYLVIGNLVARIMYELFLVVLIICRNTTEINKKLTNKEVVDKKEEKE